MENNPADRLRLLLERGKSMGRDRRTLDVWAELLEVELGDNGVDGEFMGVVMGELGLVFDLPRQIREAIQELDGDTNPFLSQMTLIERALFLNPVQNPWGNVVDGLTEPAMLALGFCAERLRREAPEPVLADEDLDAIAEEVRSLLDFVAATDLPKPLRRFVLDHLHAIEVALRRIKIDGLAALNGELLRTIGDFVVSLDVRREVGDADETDTTSGTGRIKHLISKACTWLAMIRMAATDVEKTTTAISAAKDIFGELTAGH